MKRVAIVTGGAGGISSAIAFALAKQGYAIAIVDIDETKGMETAKELAAYTETEFFKCDISKVDNIESSFKKIVERFGQADVLVNGAGIPVRELIKDIDEACWNRFVDINIRAAFFFSKMLCMHLEKRSADYGRIINISSVRSELFDANHTGYSISKAAVETMTKCFAVGYGKQKITSNCIAPGFVHTAMTEHYLEDPRAEEVISMLSPLGRMVEAEEIAATVVFLCTEDAAAINGQIVKVDGGGIGSAGLYH